MKRKIVMAVNKSAKEKVQCLLKCIAFFFVMFNFGFFPVALTDEHNDGCKLTVQDQRLSVAQAKWAVDISAKCFKIAFENKVRAYANIEGMDMARAKKEEIECMVKDPLGLVKVICFKEKSLRKPSDDIGFERDMENWFNKHDNNVKEQLDKDVYRGGIALVADENCKICHKIYKNGELIGAMVFAFPLKRDNENKGMW